MKKILVILFLLLFSITNAQVWFQRSDLGGSARHRGTSVAIGNKGYIGLGHYNGTGVNIVLKDWWQYDPSTNSWSQKADFEGNGGNGNYGVVTFGMEDKGYVAGGVFSGAETWKFVPSTNTWTQVQDCPQTMSNYIGFTIQEVGYTVVGNQVFAYNGSTESWEIKNQAPFNASIWNSSFVVDNKGYLKNGNSLWEYKPSIDQWIGRANFPGLTTGGAVGFHQNGKGYIVTGYSGGLSNVVRENWEFDPFTNQWKQLSNFPGTSRRFSTGFTIGQRSFLGTGTNGTNFKDFWEFNSLLSVDELESSISINAYPNPSSDFIKVLVDGMKVRYRVIDLSGRIIKTDQAFGEFTLEKNGIGKGLYLLELTFDNGIVKQRKIEFR